jgi:hypothetical protein
VCCSQSLAASYAAFMHPVVTVEHFFGHGTGDCFCAAEWQASFGGHAIALGATKKSMLALDVDYLQELVLDLD